MGMRLGGCSTNMRDKQPRNRGNSFELRMGKNMMDFIHSCWLCPAVSVCPTLRDDAWLTTAVSVVRFQEDDAGGVGGVLPLRPVEPGAV